jgi:hypothetical protein
MAYVYVSQNAGLKDEICEKGIRSPGGYLVKIGYTFDFIGPQGRAATEKGNPYADWPGWRFHRYRDVPRFVMKDYEQTDHERKSHLCFEQWQLKGEDRKALIGPCEIGKDTGFELFYLDQSALPLIASHFYGQQDIEVLRETDQFLPDLFSSGMAPVKAQGYFEATTNRSEAFENARDNWRRNQRDPKKGPWSQ